MKVRHQIVAALMFASFAALIARAQARPTATEELRVSVFAGATGTYTGLGGGKNLGLTAGVDVGIRSFFGLEPSLELRGTLPVHDGPVDAQENVLGGLSVSKRYGRFHPYADAFFGRGEITYENGGYITPSGRFRYQQSFSNIYAAGGGMDIDLTRSFALKADAQLQHEDVPVTTSGSLYAKALTLGVVYRFDFNHHVREIAR